MKFNLSLFGLMAIVLFTFSNCKKDKDYTEIDRQLILDYLSEHNLTATEDDSGLFYRHLVEGTGDRPTATSTITIKYKGYFLNGDVFDRTGDNQSATFFLPNLIEGWQIGIPLMRKGGKTQFFIPSRLGYGSRESGSVPANSVLIFEIDLLAF